MSSASRVVFAPPEYLLFARDTALMAQKFDPVRGTLQGDAFQIAEPIGNNALFGLAGFSASANGILAHRGGPRTRVPVTQLTWFDRTGRGLGTLAPPGPYRNPALSPDGSHVVVQRADVGRLTAADLWIIDTARQVPTRFTFADAGWEAAAPVWSPDGTRIAWLQTAGRGSQRTAFQKLATGTGKDEKLRDIPAAAVIDDWVSGIGILFHDGSRLADSAGLWVMPLDGGELRSLGEAQSIVTHARVSPDGHWIAFASSDTGRPEIYIQTFPSPVQRIQVSADGGIQPIWRSDGKELFFVAPDGVLMAVPVQLSSQATVGSPVRLFETFMEGGGIQSPGIWHQYDVTPGGRKFLINTLEEKVAQSALPITVLVNWAPAETKK